MVYAVIDTNVLVSALFSAHPDSSTVIIRNKIADGEIIPIFNSEIIDEYRAVLSRPRFHFRDELVDAILNMVLKAGISPGDPKAKGGPSPRGIGRRLVPPEDQFAAADQVVVVDAAVGQRAAVEGDGADRRI